MKRRAFTLVELLFAIGIVAVIAAILWPVAGTNCEQPRKSSCQSNLKQIALGFKQYQNDFDEYYPPVFIANAPNAKLPYGWADAIQPYMRNSEVYQCPSDANEGNQSPAQSGYTDYWYNANLMRRINRDGKIIFKTVSEMGSVSQTVLIGDGGNEIGGGHNATYNQCGDGKSLTARNQICAESESLIATYPSAQIHLGGANFSFADGSVKWIKADNASQSHQILSNRATGFNLSGKKTFSLLMRS